MFDTDGAYQDNPASAQCLQIAGLHRSEKFGALAQLVEHLTFNQVVVGSNPARPTIFKPLILKGSGVFYGFLRRL